MGSPAYIPNINSSEFTQPEIQECAVICMTSESLLHSSSKLANNEILIDDALSHLRSFLCVTLSSLVDDVNDILNLLLHPNAFSLQFSVPPDCLQRVYNSLESVLVGFQFVAGSGPVPIISVSPAVTKYISYKQIAAIDISDLYKAYRSSCVLYFSLKQITTVVDAFLKLLVDARHPFKKYLQQYSVEISLIYNSFFVDNHAESRPQMRAPFAPELDALNFFAWIASVTINEDISNYYIANGVDSVDTVTFNKIVSGATDKICKCQENSRR